MIRICQEILSEQLRINPSSEQIGVRAIVDGILKFCKQKAQEIAGADTLRELRKTGRIDFTANFKRHTCNFCGAEQLSQDQMTVSGDDSREHKSSPDA